MESLKQMDIDKVASAIEADAGHALPGLRESLTQAKAGDFSRSDARLLSKGGFQRDKSLPLPEPSMAKAKDRHGE